MRNRPVLLQVFTLEIRKIFSYRVDFWIQFVGGVLAQFTVAWFLWKAIFSYNNVEQVGGYTFRTLMLYYLLVPFVGRAIRGSEMGGIAEEIYQGTLTRYLVYPVSFFGYRFTTHCAHTFVFLFQGVVAVCLFLLVFGPQAAFSFSPADLLFALSVTMVAMLLHFTLVSTIELLAFWADNVWSLVVIVRFTTGLLGGGMLPLALFPEHLRVVLEKLPFAYFASFPIRCLMGQVLVDEWIMGMLVMTCWLMLFASLYQFVWNRGKYQYTGVGI